MSRTKWIRDWLNERVLLVHNCMECTAEEMRMWSMFNQMITEEADRIDALDFEITSKQRHRLLADDPPPPPAG
jgi:hypothetical protein